MRNNQSLNYTKWDCKYHIACIPKYRKKVIWRDSASKNLCGSQEEFYGRRYG